MKEIKRVPVFLKHSVWIHHLNLYLYLTITSPCIIWQQHACVENSKM